MWFYKNAEVAINTGMETHRVSFTMSIQGSVYTVVSWRH